MEVLFSFYFLKGRNYPITPQTFFLILVTNKKTQKQFQNHHQSN
jgi:hypothetical protein